MEGSKRVPFQKREFTFPGKHGPDQATLHGPRSLNGVDGGTPMLRLIGDVVQGHLRVFRACHDHRSSLLFQCLAEWFCTSIS